MLQPEHPTTTLPGHPEGSPRRRKAGAERTLAGDDSAVSEIIGFVLVFGIISLILLLGMIAFNKAQTDARNNVIDLRAQSVGTRVASLVVQTSLTAEQLGTSTAVRLLADLPNDLEGSAYVVYLDVANGAQAERVRVWIPAEDIEITSPVFSADAPTTFGICDDGSGGTSAPGGRVTISFNVGDHVGENCIFLEAAA